MTILEIVGVATVSLTLTTLANLIVYQYFFLPRTNKAFKEFESLVKLNDKIGEEKWVLKRSACLRALSIADNQISNTDFPNIPSGEMKKGSLPTTEDVRTCFNELACTCDGNEVITILKTILFGQFTAAIIVDLRNAVRRELQFGAEDFDTDRDKAFIGRIGKIEER